MLAAILAVAHCAAIASAIWFLPGWGWPAATSMALVASLVHHVRRHALLLSADAVIEVRLRDPDRCDLTLRGGRVLETRVDPSSFVTPALVVLAAGEEGSRRRRSVVLLPDSAGAEARRQLRVWLRHRVRAESRVSETA